VLANNHPNRDVELKKHIEMYPDEAAELQDTATSLGAKSRSPSPDFNFVPVGHISLDTEYEHSGYEPHTPGVYFIATFYVSRALQSSGLGRAAMDQIELTATSEPLNAKLLALSTVLANQEGRKEKLAALGRGMPKVEPQDWYARRGYVVYKEMEECWSEIDSTGKEWFWTAVFMRKNIT
jgi:GNAT superfamily N-acetyltransferase